MGFAGGRLFGWLKRRSEQVQPGIRDTLFGDMPWSQWQGISAQSAAVEPWASFQRAKQLLDNGDKQAAADSLQHITKTPDLESHHYLQAWHFLREMDVTPPEEKKQLLGVVVEVGMSKGIDLVAAYADRHARYYNYSAGVVWDRPNGSLDGMIDDLLRVGTIAMLSIGQWNDARPSAPGRGEARINLLSASGLHFGQGPLDALSKDQLGGPVIAAALRLMQVLIALSKQ